MPVHNKNEVKMQSFTIVFGIQPLVMPPYTPRPHLTAYGRTVDEGVQYTSHHISQAYQLCCRSMQVLLHSPESERGPVG